MHLIGDVANELALVYLIRKLGNNDAGAILPVLFKFRSCAQHDLAAACGIGLADAAAAHDDALGRKIRPLNILHQIAQFRLRILKDTDTGIDDLFEIVGWDIGGHTDGDTAGTVDQQIWKTGGKYPRLLPALIEVRVPVDSVFLNIPEHLVGDL